VCAKRIEIFHVAADDGVLGETRQTLRECNNLQKTYIGTVSNDFVLKFFPTFHAALNKNLGTQAKAFGCQIAKLVCILGETRTKTTKSESRT
jgi:hypothetical protein